MASWVRRSSRVLSRPCDSSKSINYAYYYLQMSFYTKEMRWVDAGVVLSALIITKLVSLTSLVEQQWLQTMFTVFLYFIDFSIFTAVVVGVRGEGGVAIFYLLRIGFVLSAEDHSISSSLLPAVILFVLLRIGEVVLDHLFMLSAKRNNNSSSEQKEMMRSKQQKGKYWFQVLIAALLLAFTVMVTYPISGLLPGLLLIGCLIAIAVQLARMANMPDYASRQLQSTIHINLYLYVLLCWLLGYKTSNNPNKYLIPAYIYLTILLLYCRLFITRFINKFHSLDGDLFYAVYPYAESAYSRIISVRNEDGRLRVAKAVDRVSRQLGFLIYVLGVFQSSVDNNAIWISIGVIAVNVYPIQSRQTLWQAVIEDRLKIKIKLLLLIPLLIFLHSFYTQQHCRRQIIELLITNCSNSLSRQNVLSAGMTLVTILAQMIRARQYKVMLLKFVAIMCPVVVLMMFVSLECQNLKTVLIGGYSLAICFEIIRQDRRSVVKGGKDQ